MAPFRKSVILTTDEEQKLADDYAQYCRERDELAAQGKALGTFIGWQYANNRVNIKIAKTWEEHVQNTRKR